MTWKKSLTLTVGGILLVLVVGLAAVAMFVVDNPDDVGYFLQDVQALRQAGKDMKGRPIIGRGSGMQLRGEWCGMSVATTQAMDRMPGQAGGAVNNMGDGLTVVNIDRQNGDRARRAGVRAGDVIVGIDQMRVKTLTDLDTVARKVNPEAPVLLDVRRMGQTVTLVMPAQRVASAVPAAGGPNLYCPRDGIIVPNPGPGNTCPVCGGPLHLFTPAASGVRQ